MTADEQDRLAINVLTCAGEAINPWIVPVEAARKALGFGVVESRKIVEDMYSRGVVRIIRNRAEPVDPAGPFAGFCRWEEVKAAPEGKELTRRG